MISRACYRQRLADSNVHTSLPQLSIVIIFHYFFLSLFACLLVGIVNNDLSWLFIVFGRVCFWDFCVFFFLFVSFLTLILSLLKSQMWPWIARSQGYICRFSIQRVNGPFFFFFLCRCFVLFWELLQWQIVSSILWSVRVTETFFAILNQSIFWLYNYFLFSSSFRTLLLAGCKCHTLCNCGFFVLFWGCSFCAFFHTHW